MSVDERSRLELENLCNGTRDIAQPELLLALEQVTVIRFPLARSKTFNFLPSKLHADHACFEIFYDQALLICSESKAVSRGESQ